MWAVPEIRVPSWCGNVLHNQKKGSIFLGRNHVVLGAPQLWAPFYFHSDSLWLTAVQQDRGTQGVGDVKPLCKIC